MQYLNSPNCTTTEEVMQVTVYGKVLKIIRRNGKFVKPVELKELEGTGSGLKPSAEEWILARSPLSEHSIAANVLHWGTGGLNIDKCRVAGEVPVREDRGNSSVSILGSNSRHPAGYSKQGRWPANLLMSHTLFCTQDECAEGCPVALLDRQSGIRKSGGGDKHGRKPSMFMSSTSREQFKGTSIGGDEGYASRYFQTFRETPDVPFLYTSKASRSERNAGCEALPEKEAGCYGEFAGDGRGRQTEHVLMSNNHPTVKPISLMRYLVSLTCPPGGIVLDMFAGSGTTGVACIMEGYDYLLIEQDSDYCEIARARLAYARGERYDMQLTENADPKVRIAAWGKKIVRCPVHDVSYRDGNHYTCGCKIVYTCKDNMTI